MIALTNRDPANLPAAAAILSLKDAEFESAIFLSPNISETFIKSEQVHYIESDFLCKRFFLTYGIPLKSKVFTFPIITGFWTK